MFPSFSIIGRLIAICLFITAFTGVAAASAAETRPQIPFLEQWSASPHADSKSESFRHWDEDGKVPQACAKCHSSGGFLDFIGADGSTMGSVDMPHATDTVIDCVTCHNRTAKNLSQVTFPSGVTMINTGRDAVCMLCHQGRQSGADVAAAVANLQDDKPNAELKFINVHYRAAAATAWGSMTAGGYQYRGNSYVGRFEHVDGQNGCTDCHSPHTLKVRVSTCVQCHENAPDEKGLMSIRKAAADYDGDGDTAEGIHGEIATLQTRLLEIIQTYARRVAKTAVAYDSHAYPYFFVDTNKNGKADKEEAVFKNQYKSWTPRLLKAAYNYQFVRKDPGAYTHNPRYAIQLLHDSLTDLAAPIKESTEGLVRP